MGLGKKIYVNYHQLVFPLDLLCLQNELSVFQYLFFQSLGSLLNPLDTRVNIIIFGTYTYRK